jgi:hypothetical protein
LKTMETRRSRMKTGALKEFRAYDFSVLSINQGM